VLFNRTTYLRLNLSFNQAALPQFLSLSAASRRTGGGRTVDADVIDVLLTWMVHRDCEFPQGGTTKANRALVSQPCHCRKLNPASK